MVFSRRLLCPAFLAICGGMLLLSGCVDESPGPATAVPIQPTVNRPPLATTPPAPTVLAVASPSPSAAPTGRTFIVRDGDSLSTIALAVYGDASQWRPIFDANRDVLPSESQVQVGQTLRIPPLPTATPTLPVAPTPRPSRSALITGLAILLASTAACRNTTEVPPTSVPILQPTPNATLDAVVRGRITAAIPTITRTPARSIRPTAPVVVPTAPPIATPTTRPTTPPTVVATIPPPGVPTATLRAGGGPL
jgi:LysM repeat protein